MICLPSLLLKHRSRKKRNSRTTATMQSSSSSNSRKTATRHHHDFPCSPISALLQRRRCRFNRWFELLLLVLICFKAVRVLQKSRHKEGWLSQNRFSVFFFSLIYFWRHQPTTKGVGLTLNSSRANGIFSFFS